MAVVVSKSLNLGPQWGLPIPRAAEQVSSDFTVVYIHIVHVSSTQNFQLRHWQTLCSCSGFGPSWVLLYHLKPCDAKQRSSLTTTESTERTFCGPRCEQTNASAHERASEVAGVPIQRSRDSSKNSHGSLPPPWRREGRLISLSRGSKDWTLDSFDVIRKYQDADGRGCMTIKIVLCYHSIALSDSDSEMEVVSCSIGKTRFFGRHNFYTEYIWKI